MFKHFKEIPLPLQKQILIRTAFAAIFLLLFTLLLCTGNDLYTVLPCIAMSVFCVINTFLLYRKAILNEYVVISGECTEVVLTAIRKRTKAIFLKTEEYIVQIMMKQRIHRVPVGTQLDLYVSNNTPVYEKNGAQLLHTYLAIDIKGKGGRRNNVFGKGHLQETGGD